MFVGSEQEIVSHSCRQSLPIFVEKQFRGKKTQKKCSILRNRLIDRRSGIASLINHLFSQANGLGR
jgi:hypothetical protein